MFELQLWLENHKIPYLRHGNKLLTKSHGYLFPSTRWRNFFMLADDLFVYKDEIYSLYIHKGGISNDNGKPFVIKLNGEIIQCYKVLT